MSSPLIQLRRTETIFELICRNLNIQKPITSKIIFTNPLFNLMNISKYKEKIIPASQIGTLKKSFSNNNYQENKEIKNKILSASGDFSQFYSQNIVIPFENVMPGVRCPVCLKLHTIHMSSNKQKCSCQFCHKNLDRKEVIAHNLRELYHIKGTGFTLKEAK